MDFQFLRECITALKRSPDPDRFTMETFYHDDDTNNWCGTPACVLGHWAVMKASQEHSPGWKRMSRTDELIRAVAGREGMRTVGGLTDDQVMELFGSIGCGNAETAEQAIAYIEAFIRRHGGSLEEPKPLDVCLAPEWDTVAGVKEAVACPLT